MKTVQLLDCTLREGGYLINKKFGSDRIKQIISGLSMAHIDIIEVGFLQNAGTEEGSTVYHNAMEASHYLVKSRENVQFCVLADYGRYSMERLEKKNDNSFDIIRECFFKQDRINMLNDCGEIIKKGYKLSIQPVDILDYSENELIDTLRIINEMQPYSFSIVDTFGSMYGEDLEHIYDLLNKHLNPDCKIGFHSHNNLQLSNSLAQSLIRLSGKQREIIIDATLKGMGRGAGNTSTELIALYLNEKHNGDYDIGKLIETIENEIESCTENINYGYSILNFLAGKHGAHVKSLAYLADKKLSYTDIDIILGRLSKSGLKRYMYHDIEKEYKSYIASCH